jgi:transcriptional regulator with XRE-family HTH domain
MQDAFKITQMDKSVLNKFRKAKVWTQKECAAAFGVNQSQISRWERGLQPIPGWLGKLIKCLKKRGK